MNKIVSGELFLSKEWMTALTIHPEKLVCLVTKDRAEKALDLICDHSVHFKFNKATIGMIIGIASGTSLEWMKCDFKKGYYPLVEVVNYKILIGERTYWQSFRSEDDFFKVWKRIK